MLILVFLEKHVICKMNFDASLFSLRRLENFEDEKSFLYTKFTQSSTQSETPIEIFVL